VALIVAERGISEKELQKFRGKRRNSKVFDYRTFAKEYLSYALAAVPPPRLHLTPQQGKRHRLLSEQHAVERSCKLVADLLVALLILGSPLCSLGRWAGCSPSSSLRARYWASITSCPMMMTERGQRLGKAAVHLSGLQ
jgi:hypothetical protein